MQYTDKQIVTRTVMAMAVASARYESEDAYRIDYREFFFFATNLSPVSYLFFFLSLFLFLLLNTSRGSINAYRERSRVTLFPRHLHFYFSLQISYRKKKEEKK